MKPSDFLHRYVLHNLGLKIVALALACLLWYLVVTGTLN